MAKVIGKHELGLKAMSEARAGKGSIKVPKVGQTKPVKAWRDMTDAERAEHLRDAQGIEARARERLAEMAAEDRAKSRQQAKALSKLTDAERENLRNLETKIMAEAQASEPSNPPTKASAKQEKATMAKKAKKAVKRPKAKAKEAKASVKRSKPISDKDNKTGVVLTMLQSAKGCTSAEVCAATGWAAVSIPPIAKRAGLKLRKEPEGRGVRYFATAA